MAFMQMLVPDYENSEFLTFHTRGEGFRKEYFHYAVLPLVISILVAAYTQRALSWDFGLMSSIGFPW